MMWKFVVVEDSRLEMKNIVDIISRTDDCEVIGRFYDGQSAYKFLLENDADALVTDIQMGKMTGLELIRKLNENKIEIEKIIVSCYSYFENAKEAIKEGVSEFVPKPFVDGEFEEVLERCKERMLANRKKREEICDIKNELQDVIPILKENFYRGILYGYKESEFNSIESMLNIDIKNKHKTIMKIRFPKIRGNISIDAVSNFIVRRMSELAPSKIEIQPIVIKNDEIDVVILSDKDDYLNIFYTVTAVKNDIVREFKEDVLAAVSNSYIDASLVTKAERNCENVLEEGTELYKNAVLFSSDEENASNSFMPGRLCAELETLLTERSSSADELLDKYGSCLHDKSTAKQFVYCYVNLIEIIMEKYSITLDSLFGAGIMWDKLEHFDTIIAPETWIKNITALLTDAIYTERQAENNVVKRIREYVIEHYGEKITLRTLSKKYNFSERQISRMFVNVTGISFSRYLTNYRMEVAKDLLKMNISVSDVMEKVGYQDYKHFKDLFKKHTGVGPGEYRTNSKALKGGTKNE